MKKLDFLQESHADHTVFTMKGPLTLDNLFTVQNAFRADEAPLTIVDMTKVPYVDSAGIGALVNAQISRDTRKRKLVLAGVRPRVKQTLEITRVASVFRFADTIDAAKSGAI